VIIIELSNSLAYFIILFEYLRNLKILNNEIWLSVSNPIKLKQGVISSGKGLMNLSQRYKLLCNRELIIENDEDKFIIKVPLLYE
jgi:hypothetical protein